MQALGHPLSVCTECNRFNFPSGFHSCSFASILLWGGLSTFNINNNFIVFFNQILCLSMFFCFKALAIHREFGLLFLALILKNRKYCLIKLVWWFLGMFSFSPFVVLVKLYFQDNCLSRKIQILNDLIGFYWKIIGTVWRKHPRW